MILEVCVIFKLICVTVTVLIKDDYVNFIKLIFNFQQKYTFHHHYHHHTCNAVI